MYEDCRHIVGAQQMVTVITIYLLKKTRNHKSTFQMTKHTHFCTRKLFQKHPSSNILTFSFMNRNEYSASR